MRTARLLTLLMLAALAALVLIAPGAQAQEDLNSRDACKAEYGEDAPFDEFACIGAAALHLREIFEGFSEWVFLGYVGLIALAIVAWIAILLWRILPRRVLRLTADKTIAEIEAGESATYNLVLENRRKRRPVEVELSVNRPPQSWSASLAVQKELPSGFKELVGEDDALRVMLTARKAHANTAEIMVHVQTPPDAHPEQWAELDVTAVPFYKNEPRVRRTKEARVVTLIKEPAERLRIRNVEHEPVTFRPGDAVRTVVHVANDGKEDAPITGVVLSVNGEETGRHELTLGAGTHDEIVFHWTAPEDRARVRIALETNHAE